MTVVSNTSPLRYLIAVGKVDLVAQIFHQLLIPREVARELTDPSAPREVRQWMAEPPAWLGIRESSPPNPELARQLDRGEAEAVQLAIDLQADYVLIDELRGRTAAAARGLVVIGALGILLESYRRQLIHNPLEILAELRACRFRLSRRLVLEFEDQIRRFDEARAS
jgi:predicted nucleic acid-binding protein